MEENVVSVELTNEIIKNFQEQERHLLSNALEQCVTRNFQNGDRLRMPFTVDGVIDYAIFNFDKKRFEYLEFEMATEGIESIDNISCLCDESKTVRINL